MYRLIYFEFESLSFTPLLAKLIWLGCYNNLYCLSLGADIFQKQLLQQLQEEEMTVERNFYPCYTQKVQYTD